MARPYIIAVVAAAAITLLSAAPALAAVGDSVSGTGRWIQASTIEVTVNATSAADGSSPSGTATAIINPDTSPLVFSGPVTCMTTAGHVTTLLFTNTNPSSSSTSNVTLTLQDVAGGPDKGTVFFNSSSTPPITTCPLASALFSFTSGDISVVDHSPPTTCTMTAIRRGNPDQADVTVTSPGGLQSINHVVVSNGSVSVPAFPAGTTSPVIVTASKTVAGTPTQFSFNAVNQAGDVQFCA